MLYFNYSLLFKNLFIHPYIFIYVFASIYPRGLREELGLDVLDVLSVIDLGPPEFLFVNHHTINRINRQWTQTFYVVVKRNKIKINVDETSAVKWIPKGEAVSWITYCDNPSTQLGCRTCTDGSNITLSPMALRGGAGAVQRFDSFGSFVQSKLQLAIKYNDDII